MNIFLRFTVLTMYACISTSGALGKTARPVTLYRDAYVSLRYLHKTLRLIAKGDESLSADGKWLETTTGRLRHGKLRYVTTRKKADWK